MMARVQQNTNTTGLNSLSDTLIILAPLASMLMAHARYVGVSVYFAQECEVVTAA